MTLYRGFRDKAGTGIRQNKYLSVPRRPLHSAQFVHDVADNWFFSKFGIRARSQTIFCTQDIKQAEQYGTPFVITVPEEFTCSLIYSQHVTDFLEIDADLQKTKCQAEIEDWLDSKVYEVINDINQLPVGFMGEVMLFCEHYEVISL